MFLNNFNNNNNNSKDSLTKKQQQCIELCSVCTSSFILFTYLVKKKNLQYKIYSFNHSYILFIFKKDPSVFK